MEPTIAQCPEKGILELPREIAHDILMLLCATDLCAVARTCRALNSVVRVALHRKAPAIILRYLDWIGVCRLPQRPIRKSFPRTQAEYALAHLYIGLYRDAVLAAYSSNAVGIRKCPLLTDLIARRRILELKYEDFVERGVIAALRGDACRCESYCSRDKCRVAMRLDADLVAWCQWLDETEFGVRMRRGDEAEQDPLPMLTCCNIEAIPLRTDSGAGPLRFGHPESAEELLREHGCQPNDAIAMVASQIDRSYDYSAGAGAFFSREATRLAACHLIIHRSVHVPSGGAVIDFVLGTYCAADVLCWGRLRDAGVAYSFYMNRHIGFPTHDALSTSFPWLTMNASEPRSDVGNAHFWLASANMRRSTPPKPEHLAKIDLSRLAWPKRGRFPLLTYFVGELDSSALPTLRALCDEYLRRGVVVDLNRAAEGAGSVPLHHATYGFGATRDIDNTIPAIVELVRRGARMPAEVPLAFLRHRCIFPVPDPVVIGHGEALTEAAQSVAMVTHLRAESERHVMLGPFSAYFIGWLFGEHQRLALKRGDNAIVRHEYLHFLTSLDATIFPIPDRDELGYCLAVVSLLTAAYRWGNDATMLLAARELAACGADPLLHVRGKDTYRRITNSHLSPSAESLFGEAIAKRTSALLSRTERNLTIALSAFESSCRHLVWIADTMRLVGMPVQVTSGCADGVEAPAHAAAAEARGNARNLARSPSTAIGAKSAPQLTSFGTPMLRDALNAAFDERALQHAATEWPIATFAKLISSATDPAFVTFVDHLVHMVRRQTERAWSAPSAKIVDDYIMGAVQDVSSRKPRLPWPTQLTEYVASVAARAQREAGDAVTMETRTGKRKRLETAKAVPEAVTAKRVRRGGAETRA